MEAIEEQLSLLTESLRTNVERRLQTDPLGMKSWKLPQPRVCVMEAKRSRTIQGWYSSQRWKQGAVKLNEIVLTPAAVSKGVFNAAGIVAHELVHLANAMAGREDTSRQGRYHNKVFKTTAEVVGLVVTKDGIHGWCDTQLGDELKEHVRDLIRRGVLDSHVFKYQRSGGASKASLVKLTCACGVFAYVTRKQANTVILRCGKCGEILTATANRARR
jgi:predicted SprT family Zn-dependent metalloprotease